MLKSSILLCSFFLLTVSSNCFAANFSAFVKDRQLYITIIGENCNHFGGNLIVEPQCKEDRPAKNEVITCKVRAMIFSTEMACEDMKETPVVIQMNLDENNVAVEAQNLLLRYGLEEIEVEIR